MDSRAPSPLLLPLALVQGLIVRQRTPRLPPASDCEGEAIPRTLDGDAGASRPLRLLAVGDSIVAGVGCASQSEALTGRFAVAVADASRRAVRWQASGLNGATAESALHLIPEAADADLCLVSVGVNDAVQGTTPRRFSDSLARLVGALRERSPRAPVLFAGVPPLSRFPALPQWPLGALLGARAARLQAAAQSLSERDALSGVLRCYEFPGLLPRETFSPDGFHPGPIGCAIWAEALLRLIDLDRLGRALTRSLQDEAASCSRW